MIVMPSNSTGWFWQILAYETGCIGHLYSPGAERDPKPWIPYAFDNGCFALWEPKKNSFNETKWSTQVEREWMGLMEWGLAQSQRPLWAVVPDRPGSWIETRRKWLKYAFYVKQTGIPLALAVQDDATPASVRELRPEPEVIAVGGSTAWKWGSVEEWAKEFPRVHVLRCNSPAKLEYLHKLGVESCDGTGWNRGDRKQTQGLEEWLRKHTSYKRVHHPLYPHVCRKARNANLASTP